MSKGNIKIIKGNIFTTDMDVIAHGVSCDGMVIYNSPTEGINWRYTEWLKDYQSNITKIGDIHLYKEEDGLKPVLNMITQVSGFSNPTLSAIEKALNNFVHTYQKLNIKSIAIPILGNWENNINQKYEVMKLMIEYLAKCDILVELWDYDPYAEDELFPIFVELWRETNGSCVQLCGPHAYNAINYAVTSHNIKSFEALINQCGVGQVSVRKCVQAALNAYRKNLYK